jgi:hypothetical protein
MTNNMISSNNKLLSIRWIYLDDNFDWNHIDIYGENLEDESQLNSIYIVCKPENKEWSKNYTKVSSSSHIA